jgi:hypothetical protein
MKIIDSAKNYVVLMDDNKDFYCFSYKKLIAKTENMIIHVYKNKIETEKNRCHYGEFKNIIKKYLTMPSNML